MMQRKGIAEYKIDYKNYVKKKKKMVAKSE